MKKIIDFDDLIVKSYDRIRLEGKSYGSFVKEYIVKFLNDDTKYATLEEEL